MLDPERTCGNCAYAVQVIRPLSKDIAKNFKKNGKDPEKYKAVCFKCKKKKLKGIAYFYTAFNRSACKFFENMGPIDDLNDFPAEREILMPNGKIVPEIIALNK